MVATVCRSLRRGRCWVTAATWAGTGPRPAGVTRGAWSTSGSLRTHTPSSSAWALSTSRKGRWSPAFHPPSPQFNYLPLMRKSDTWRGVLFRVDTNRLMFCRSSVDLVSMAWLNTTLVCYLACCVRAESSTENGSLRLSMRTGECLTHCVRSPYSSGAPEPHTCRPAAVPHPVSPG